MKWDMEVEEIEAVLKKIWDLHDRLSDAIHSVSRAHFLRSVKNSQKFDELCLNRRKTSIGEFDQKMGPGFVFVKESRGDKDDFAVHEAKSLYAIRTALENLEDQLEFFHDLIRGEIGQEVYLFHGYSFYKTIVMHYFNVSDSQMAQTQQRVERDAAIARLEQSRIVLATRLAEHQGKKYKVIEEAQELVGDAQNAGQFFALEHLYGSTQYPSGVIQQQKGTKPNPLVNFFLSAFTTISNSLRSDNTVGILGNAAMLAVSILAFVQMNQSRSAFDRETRKAYHTRGTSSDLLTELDVFWARG